MLGHSLTDINSAKYNRVGRGMVNSIHHFCGHQKVFDSTCTELASLWKMMGRYGIPCKIFRILKSCTMTVNAHVRMRSVR